MTFKSSVSDKWFEPLGKIVVYFGLLEKSLDFAIWLLLFGNVSTEQRTGQIVTAELMFKNKIPLFSSLYQHRFPDQKPFLDLKNICSKLNVANDRRNDILHSTWLGEGKKINITAKQKRGFEFNYEDVSAVELDRITNFISAVNLELMKFFTTLPWTAKKPGN